MSGRSTERVVRTIGHSNRKLDEFLGIMRSTGVETVVDLRTHPNSRRFPHFSEGNLEQALLKDGIDYRHYPELGGYRDPLDDSPNTALPPGFQAVADHLNTNRGQQALNRLEDLVRKPEGTDVALLCAEKDFTDCHRKLIADHLTVRGLSILHVIDEETTISHELHEHARPEGKRVTYPGLV